MPRKRDLTGQDFGRLTVIDLHGLDSQGRILWDCLCDCGQLTRVMTWDLVSGHTRSCGCLKSDVLRERGRRRQTPVSIGSRHGLLTVTGEAGRDHAGRMLVSARCDCGGRTVARWNNLLTGVTRSCGCRKRAGRRRNTSAQYGDLGAAIEAAEPALRRIAALTARKEAGHE